MVTLINVLTFCANKLRSIPCRIISGFVLFLSASCFCISPQEAWSVPLANPSFEVDAVATNSFTTSNPTGWNIVEVNTADVGMQNGTTGVPSASHLSQHLYMNADSDGSSGTGSVQYAWQSPLASLTPNTLYTLTFDVANRDRGNDGLEAKDTDSDPFTTISAYFTLGSDDENFAQAVGTPYSVLLSTIANGTYALDQTIIFSTAGLTPGELSQKLNFVIRQETTSVTLSQSNWDNFRLEANALPVVPEPGTLGMIVISLVCIGRRGKRSRCV